MLRSLNGTVYKTQLPVQQKRHHYVDNNDISVCRQQRHITMSTTTTYHHVDRQQRHITMSTTTTYHHVDNNDISHVVVVVTNSSVQAVVWQAPDHSVCLATRYMLPIHVLCMQACMYNYACCPYMYMPACIILCAHTCAHHTYIFTPRTTSCS